MLTERRIRSPRPYSVFQASELQLKQLLLAGGTGISEYTGAGSRGGSRLYWHGRRIHCRIICSGGTPRTGDWPSADFRGKAEKAPVIACI